eukprot:COSAG01_NODE_885_length_12924_cov_63.044990_5_plen_55_part_00
MLQRLHQYAIDRPARLPGMPSARIFARSLRRVLARTSMVVCEAVIGHHWLTCGR